MFRAFHNSWPGASSNGLNVDALQWGALSRRVCWPLCAWRSHLNNRDVPGFVQSRPSLGIACTVLNHWTTCTRHAHHMWKTRTRLYIRTCALLVRPHVLADLLVQDFPLCSCCVWVSDLYMLGVQGKSIKYYWVRQQHCQPLLDYTIFRLKDKNTSPTVGLHGQQVSDVGITRPTSQRWSACTESATHPRGLRSRDPVHLGRLTPQTPCNLGAAPPNPCAWGLRLQANAMDSILDCYVSFFNNHW